MFIVIEKCEKTKKKKTEKKKRKMKNGCPLP
jgi:hypothetical protein